MTFEMINPQYISNRLRLGEKYFLFNIQDNQANNHHTAFDLCNDNLKSVPEKNNQDDIQQPLLTAIENIHIKENQKQETCHVRENNGKEEELFAQDCTVVMGEFSEINSKISFSATMKTPVVTLCWADFLLPDRNFINKQAVSIFDNPAGRKQSGVGIFESEHFTFIANNGEKYSAKLPCQVSSVWPILNSILVERKPCDADYSTSENRPPLFSMFTITHPLDEIAPVIMKVPNSDGTFKVSFVTNVNQKIVFVSEDPLIVVTVDKTTNQYSIWKIKKALQEEYTNLYAVHPDGQANVAPHAMSHHTSTVTLAATVADVTLGQDYPPHNDHTQKCLSPFAASLSRLKNTGSAKSHLSRTTFQHLQQEQQQSSQSQTTNRTSLRFEIPPHMKQESTLCDGEKPSTQPTVQEKPRNHLGLTFQQLKTRRRSGLSDHLSIYDLDNMTQQVEDGVPTEEPLLPKACLEMIWSECLPSGGGRDNPGHMTVPSSTPLHPSNKNNLRVGVLKASYNRCHPPSSTPDHSTKLKCPQPNVFTESNTTPCGFVAQDLADHKWICFLNPIQNRLICLPCSVNSNGDGRLILGSPHAIKAKDAKYLPNKRLTAILDPTGSTIFLYSGIRKICMLGSVVSAMAFNPWSPHQKRDSRHPRQRVQSFNYNERIVHFSTQSTLGPTDPAESLMNLHDEIIGISPVKRASLDSVHRSHFNSIGSLLDTTMWPDGVPAHTANLSQQYLSIKEATDNAFSVELSNGKLMRVYLPKMAETRLVKICLTALQKILPKDVGVSLLSRWYTIRNSPGRKDKETSATEWTQFTDFLLTLAGFNRSHDLSMEDDCDAHGDNVLNDRKCAPNPHSCIAPPSKKPCSDSSCTSNHWEMLLSRMKASDNVMANITGTYDFNKLLNKPNHCTEVLLKDTLRAETMNSILLNHLPSALFVLHIVYESEKLNSLSWEELENIALLNYYIAKALSLTKYCAYYVKDFPKIGSRLNHVPLIKVSQTSWPAYFQPDACDLFDWISRFLSEQSVSRYPYISGVNDLSVQIITAFIIMSGKSHSQNLNQTIQCKIQNVSSPDSFPACLPNIPEQCLQSGDAKSLSLFQRVVLYLSKVGLTSDLLDSLPAGLSLLFRCALEECRSDPPPNCSATAYSLIGRNDLSQQMQILAVSNDGKSSMERWAELVKPYWDIPRHDKASKYPILSLLESDPTVQISFKSDLRVREAFRLLQSSTRVKVASSLRPEATEQEVSEELESQLLAACVRTMSLPVGRGMLTLSCQVANVPAQLQVEKLCLNGRSVNTRHSNVDLTKIDTPPTMKLWPEFHNGVATGLMIARNANINSTWILYNCRTKMSACNSPEKAGIIFALGLQGHLNQLHQCYIRDYMKKLHDISNMAMILGLCASKRGSMEDTLTRTVAVHFKRLLPASTAELEVPSLSQAGAIMGLGLLYEGSSHRHMAQLLLEEMGKPAGSDLEASMEREVLSLICGFSLGLIMLRHCEHSFTASDVAMAEKLHAYMVGGHRSPTSQPQDEAGASHGGFSSNTARPSGLAGSSRQQSSFSFNSANSNPQIREEDRYNVDVTSPGATMALGLMFFGSGNRCVSEWLSVPDTQYLLDFVRPDLLQLRMISLGLVNWHTIEPTEAWIASHMPPVLSKHAFKKNLFKDEINCDIDFETMNLSCLHMMAGCSFVIGIRFAGTCNEEAAITLRKVLGIMLEGAANISNPNIKSIGKPQIEQATAVVILSISMVMAGSGNIEILQIVRRLRSRVGSQLMYSINYGCHMMYSMAIGLLFLGGCKLTLSNTPEAAAILLISLFPRFPSFSSDNRYHLQALRHLYVLAVEPRRLVAVDVDTHQVVSTDMCATMKNGKKFWSQDSVILPANILDQLESVEINYQSDLYWSHLFRSSCSDWNILIDSLKQGGYLFVKKKFKKDLTEEMKVKPLISGELSHRLSARHLYQLKIIVNFIKFSHCDNLSGIAHRIVTVLHKEFTEKRKDLRASLFNYYHKESSECSTLLNAFLIWFSLPSAESLNPSHLPAEIPPVKTFLEAFRGSPHYLPVESAWWLYKIAYDM